MPPPSQEARENFAPSIPGGSIKHGMEGGDEGGMDDDADVDTYKVDSSLRGGVRLMHSFAPGPVEASSCSWTPPPLGTPGSRSQSMRSFAPGSAGTPGSPTRSSTAFSCSRGSASDPKVEFSFAGAPVGFEIGDTSGKRESGVGLWQWKPMIALLVLLLPCWCYCLPYWAG